jgi:hypothetical protein
MSMPFELLEAPSRIKPGLDPRRLVALIRAAVERSRLDLSGQVVLTEAASGAYVVTPLLAACAGAERVYAMTRSTKYGTAKAITEETLALATMAGVRHRIEIVNGRSPAIVSRADIVTNSGHVRPIDAEFVRWMKPSAVISLMYEGWEFRPGDIDLEACRQRGIRIGATNERHPDVDVFSFLGMMATKLLLDAQVAVYRSSLLLLCDNPFCGFISRTLRRAGATVDVAASVAEAPVGTYYDAILVSLTPQPSPTVTAADAREIARRWPGAVVAQFWGDIDREALAALEVPVCPIQPPAAGHMAILPSAIGPEVVIRLQAGGLKVGELLRRGAADPEHDCLERFELPQVRYA